MPKFTIELGRLVRETRQLVVEAKSREELQDRLGEVTAWGCEESDSHVIVCQEPDETKADFVLPANVCQNTFRLTIDELLQFAKLWQRNGNGCLAIVGWGPSDRIVGFLSSDEDGTVISFQVGEAWLQEDGEYISVDDPQFRDAEGNFLEDASVPEVS